MDGRDRRRKRQFQPTLGDGQLESRQLLSTVPMQSQRSVTSQVTATTRTPISERTIATVHNRVDWAFSRFRNSSTADSVASGGLSFLLDTLLGDKGSSDSSSGSTTSTKNPEYKDYNLLMERVGTTLTRLPKGFDTLYNKIVNKASPGRLKPANADAYRDWVNAQITRYVAEGVRSHRFVITTK